MTGPEHYRSAEQLLAQAERVNNDLADGRYPQHEVNGRNAGMRVLIDCAQVHATLAVAAATAELDADEGPAGGSATGRDGNRSRAWSEVLGG
jgi:hypothetical protein